MGSSPAGTSYGTIGPGSIPATGDIQGELMMSIMMWLGGYMVRQFPSKKKP